MVPDLQGSDRPASVRKDRRVFLNDRGLFDLRMRYACSDPDTVVLQLDPLKFRKPVDIDNMMILIAVILALFKYIPY